MNPQSTASSRAAVEGMAPFKFLFRTNLPICAWHGQEDTGLDRGRIVVVKGSKRVIILLYLLTPTYTPTIFNERSSVSR